MLANALLGGKGGVLPAPYRAAGGTDVRTTQALGVKPSNCRAPNAQRAQPLHEPSVPTRCRIHTIRQLSSMARLLTIATS